MEELHLVSRRAEWQFFPFRKDCLVLVIIGTFLAVPLGTTSLQLFHGSPQSILLFIIYYRDRSSQNLGSSWLKSLDFKRNLITKRFLICGAEICRHLSISARFKRTSGRRIHVYSPLNPDDTQNPKTKRCSYHAAKAISASIDQSAGSWGKLHGPYGRHSSTTEPNRVGHPRDPYNIIRSRNHVMKGKFLGGTGVLKKGSRLWPGQRASTFLFSFVPHISYKNGAKRSKAYSSLTVSICLYNT